MQSGLISPPDKKVECMMNQTRAKSMPLPMMVRWIPQVRASTGSSMRSENRQLILTWWVRVQRMVTRCREERTVQAGSYGAPNMRIIQDGSGAGAVRMETWIRRDGSAAN